MIIWCKEDILLPMNHLAVSCSRSKRIQKKIIIYAKIYPGNGSWKEKGKA